MLKKKISRTIALFLTGAIGYNIIEILWRQRTHISMSIAGGIGLNLLYPICRTKLPLAVKCLLGSCYITLIELTTGLIVNCRMKKNIWDYSSRRFNFLGQICPLYSSLWFLLCIPVLPVLKAATTHKNAFSSKDILKEVKIT